MAGGKPQLLFFEIKMQSKMSSAVLRPYCRSQTQQVNCVCVKKKPGGTPRTDFMICFQVCS